MRPVAFSLGSNLGDKAGTVRRALGLLETVGIARDLHCSSLWRTPPWGPVAQDPYVNACAIGTTDLAPFDLLRRIKAVEVAMGRTDTVRWGARIIDIDILVLGDLALDAPGLTLPHREMLNRGFVLLPLNEIAPDLRVRGVTVAEAARCVDATGVERLAE